MEDYQSPWKAILAELLSPIGGHFVLYCNFDTSEGIESSSQLIIRNVLMRGRS